LPLGARETYIRRMQTVVLDEDALRTVPADVDGDHLWVSAGDLHQAGWELRAEGACRGTLCVPIPPARRADVLRADGAMDLAALARLRGQAVVHDDARSVWVLGRTGEMLEHTRRSLEAPDFALPDMSGRVHRLAEHRGRKVVLASWASW